MTWLEKARQRRGEIDALAAERAALLARLTDAQAARERLQAFIDTQDWGTLDSGADIAAGDIVRFGALRYRAKSGHTKALTRSPLNIIYWEAE